MSAPTSEVNKATAAAKAAAKELGRGPRKGGGGWQWKEHEGGAGTRRQLEGELEKAQARI